MQPLNFGEPEHPVLEEVVPFLERIFGGGSLLRVAGTRHCRCPRRPKGTVLRVRISRKQLRKAAFFNRPRR
jgi:hypothetical protein